MRLKLVTLLAVAGLFAALSANWGPEAAITSNRLENSTFGPAHKVVYGTDGVGHLVWTGGGNVGQPAVYYKRYYPKTGWTSDYKLASNGDSPSIVLDVNGKDIHVAWWGYKKVGSTNYHILYQKCVPGKTGTGGWVGTPTDLCNNAAGHSYAGPCMAGGPGGQLVVTWVESWLSGADTVRTYGFREYAAGQWRAQEMIEDPIPSYRWSPSIATDVSGNVFVAYYGTRSLQPKDSIHVYVKRRIGGVWQAWENVTSSAGFPDTFVMAHVEVDPVTSYPHVVCHSFHAEYPTPGQQDPDYSVFHTYRSASGWTIPAMIDTTEWDLAPSMVFAANGTAHVIWQEPRGIGYSSRDPETGVWSTPSEIAHNGSVSYRGASLTMGPGGTLYGVWTHYDMSQGAQYPYQIWGASSSGSFGSQSAGAVEPVRGLTLDVSPNPASRGIVVGYALPAAGNVSLRFYDVGGKLVKTVDCGYLQAGNNAVRLSGLGLTRGAYILKLESCESSQTRKLVIE